MTTALRTCLALAFSLTLSLAFSGPLWAAGTETDDTKPPEKTKTTTVCKDGKVWDEARKKCVNPKKASLDDTGLFMAARELAYDGQYENAIKVLQVARNQNDPRILNYMGYANRKAGRMDIGMAYYKRALQQDENYILARSYMGQALMEQGDIQGAKVQLVEIRDRGGENTWAFRALKQALGGVATY